MHESLPFHRQSYPLPLTIGCKQLFLVYGRGGSGNLDGTIVVSAEIDPRQEMSK